jgi:hypothetical protein
MSLGAPRGKPEDIKEWGGDTFFVLPWSWEEMLEAANDDLFVKEHYNIVRHGNTVLEDLPEGKHKQDKRKQLFIDAMFWKRHWAGTSARYMFFLPLSDVKQALDEGIKHISNYVDLLAGNVGSNAHGSVHRLFFNPPDADYAEFTSRYVLQRLMRRDKTHAFFNGMEAVARETKNQAFLGWVFEARINHMIYLKSQVGVNSSVTAIDEKVHVQLREQQTESDSTDLTFSVDHMLKFDNDSHAKALLMEAKVNGELIGDTWMIPNKFNQGCFDLVTLRSSAEGECSVWAWQATVAGDHSKKLSYLRTFVNVVTAAGIKVKDVSLCALLPNNSAAKDFKWKQEVVTAGRGQNAILINIMVGYMLPPAM